MKTKTLHIRKALILTALVLFNGSLAFSQTAFVSPTGSGAGGTSWATAYTDINAAIAAGASKIYVQKGNYPAASYTLPARAIYIKGGYPTSNSPAVPADTSGYDPIANATTLNGTNSAPIINVNGTAEDITLIGLILTGGSDPIYPVFGSTAAFGTFTNAVNYNFQQLIVTGNTAASTSIANFWISNLFTGSNVKFSNCLFGGADATGAANSSAGNVGTAILVENNDAFALVIDGCGFTNNGTASTTIDGGAIRFAGNGTSGGSYTISNSTFCNNTAGEYGGAIALSSVSSSAAVNVTNCNFYKNSSTTTSSQGGGGAIWANESGINCSGCIFDQNSAASTIGCGAVYLVNSGSVFTGVEQVSNSIFYENNSGGGNGAIYFNGAFGGFTVDGSKFYGNYNAASSRSGAISVTGTYANSTISNSVFYSNTTTSLSTYKDLSSTGANTITLSNDSLELASSSYASPFALGSGNFYGNPTGNPAPSEPTVTCPTPALLPVTLLTFTAVKNGNAADLAWSTAQEVNFSHFEVQALSASNVWNSITSVPSSNPNGNSSLVTDYSYTDPSARTEANNGTVLYRLKMVDLDGSFTYSTTVPVKFGTSTTISALPNPATSQVTIIGLSGSNELQLYDMVGKLVSRTTAQGTTGTVNVQGLASGMYFIKIVNTANGSVVATEKIVKE